MIDGLKAACVGLDPQEWRAIPLLDFSRPVSERTGVMGKISEAQRFGLLFRISNEDNGSSKPYLLGSLHRHRNKGEENGDLFTFEEVAEEVERLKDGYKIPLQTAYLHRLEAGFNLPTDVPPAEIIKQAISHRRRPFSLIRRKDRKAGKEAVRDAYTVKVYDKSHGQKNAEGKYILRMEVQYHRMRDVQKKCGIHTLSDLQDTEKLERLAALTIKLLSDIIYFDLHARPVGLTARQRERWARYGNPNYWGEITRTEYYKAKENYKTLRQKGGVSDTGEWLLKRVEMAVKEMRQKKQKKGDVCHGITGQGKAEKKVTFATLECLSPNVTFEGHGKGDVSERKDTAKKGDRKRRFCKTCGREITDQNPRSVFCSERLYGKEAKKCRNADSNRRAGKRRIVERAIRKNMRIWITYEVDGVKYTDELTPQELYLTREWIDRICSVRTEDQRTMQGKEAQRQLQEWQKEHGGGGGLPPAAAPATASPPC